MFAGPARRGANWSLPIPRLGAPRRRGLTLTALALTTVFPSVAFAQTDPPPGVEDVGARTEYSRTFIEPDGMALTRLSAEPVNYLDGVGRWQPIDNTLKSDGAVLRNAA